MKRDDKMNESMNLWKRKHVPENYERTNERTNGQPEERMDVSIDICKARKRGKESAFPNDLDRCVVLNVDKM